MHNSEILHLSKFVVAPEYDSISEYDHFNDLDFDGNTDQFHTGSEYDDLDDYLWDED
jgi:hypothetical protein